MLLFSLLKNSFSKIGHRIDMVNWIVMDSIFFTLLDFFHEFFQDEVHDFRDYE
jgi:hypothetical protein